MESVRKRNHPRKRRAVFPLFGSATMISFLKLKQRRKRKSGLKRRHKLMGVSLLPMDCIAHILSFTSPRNVCASFLVSSLFRSAAECDEIWEKFLPMGYKDIILKLSLNLDSFSSKKDLFFYLYGAPILLEGGNKSLTIDPNKGTISLMIGSKDLMVSWWSSEIEWTNTTTIGQSIEDSGEIMDHWRWILVSDSRFPEALELVSDCWDQISGKVYMKWLSSNTNYSVYLVFKLAEYSNGFEREDGDYEDDACLYGVADGIVNFVKGRGSASGVSHLSLEEDCQPRANTLDTTHESETQLLKNGDDGWIEVKLGEFCSGERSEGEVEMILLCEDAQLHWKARLWMVGVIIQGIEIRRDENKH